MIKKFPQINFVYDRYKKATPTKKASVEIRVTYNYKQKYISTGVLLYPSQWKNGKITNCPDMLQISQTLDGILTDVRQIILDMIKNDSINISVISERLKELHQEKTSFIDFCKQRALVRKYGKKPDSQERYNRFIKYFIKWGKIKDYEDVTEKNIIAYDKYLSSTGMKPYSKWNNYHRFLNSFIMDAIDAGYIRKNPYKWVIIEKCKDTYGIEKYLSPTEFEILKSLKMPTTCLERVRDLFIFQTYTCLSYTDLRHFDVHLIKEIKGMKVYVGSRDKTDKPFTIPLFPPAMEILNKYNGKLPVISNAKYNKYLKEVAAKAKLNKPISTHWARHTGATLMLNNGVDMRVVAKICGHSSAKITEKVYAKLLDETVVDAIQKIKKNI